MSSSEVHDAEPDAESGTNLVGLIPTILWERRWWIIVPGVLGLIASIAAILFIQPVYRSAALMQVQSPQLPNSVIGNDFGEVIDRRMARIHQQVTSRPDLIALIERHGLYSDERRSQPMSEVIEEMRSAVSLTPTQANLPNSQAEQRTIAFELAFDYEDPSKAQAVAQDLMDRIVELDATGNVEQAASTVQFLTDQAKGLDTQIAELQSQIAEINARNGGILTNSNMAVIGGNSGSYDVQIAALQRDNASLINQKNVTKSADTRDPVVVNAESQLAALRAVYSETHPDVVIAKQRLAEARELAKSNTSKLPIDVIDQQISFNNSQIAALRAARSQEMAQLNTQLTAQARAPLIQQQIGELQQRLAALNTQYEGVQTRLLAAKAGVRAEDEQMGERLSIVEPPVVPDTPSWPNRLLLAAIGIGGGLALGVVLAFAIELILRPIRDPSTLAYLVGAKPLAVVPVIKARPTPQTGGRLSTFNVFPERLQFWRANR